MAENPIRDTTKDLLDAAYSKHNKSIKSKKLRGYKTLKIKFVDGNFQVVKNVIEYEVGNLFLYLAISQKNNKPFALLFERDRIEDLGRLDIKGTYKSVKVKKVWKN